MRKISLIQVLGVVLIILAAAQNAAADERMSVRSNTANIRSGPGLKETTLWQVEKYYPVVIIEKKGEWRRIKDFEGDQGWVHISTLDKTPTVIVQSNKCNLRAGPGTQHAIAFTVEKGIPFKVLKRKGDWLEVEHSDGDRGWLHKPLVW
jgi:SH3-like domain-containing protein